MLADRALLRVSGDDAHAFLQGLVTQDMATLAPGAPRWSALLTPQGKVLFDFLLWADGYAVLIDCEAARAEALARRLAIYRLRRPISIDPVGSLAVHWAPSGTQGVDDPRWSALGRRWIAPPAAHAAGWLAHRLAQGVTEGVAELGDDKTLWLECNADLLGGVSFTKGCYVGQENTARMHYRGKVNRRLAVIPMADAGHRMRVSYPELDLAVDHLPISAWGSALRPPWLLPALGD